MIDFDWEQFEKLCEYPDILSREDVAYIMGCSVDTCERRVREKYPDVSFAAFRVQRQGRFRRKLLDLQVRSAERLNPMILKHLGENYLDQSSKHKVEIPNATINLNYKLPVKS
jgi:hypothetical protein